MLNFTPDAATRDAFANLARKFGTDPAKTDAAVASVSNALTNSMTRAAASRSGLADLLEIIGAPGRDAYLQADAPLQSPQVEADGIGILSQLLGSRDQSRAVAARAAKASGLGVETVKAMLPSIAAVVMGSMNAKTQAAFGDILKIPGLDEIAREARDDMGGGGQLAPPQYDSPLPLPGEPPRRYSPSSGNSQPAPQRTPPSSPTKDTGSIREQRPLPIPGDDVPGMGRHDDNPYGDLSDILRRGGFRIPGGARVPGGEPSGRAGPAQPRIPDTGSAGGGGDLLSTIIRNVLGSVLGGNGRGTGLIGWIVRFIIMRYGAQIVQTILRRILGR